MKPEYFLPILMVPSLWYLARLSLAHRRADQFLQRLYDDHRDIWESIGRPCGSWWSAPEQIIVNPFAKFRFRWKWLEQDPEWLERAPELRGLFQQMREGYREWFFRAMPTMIASVLVFVLIVKLLDG